MKKISDNVFKWLSKFFITVGVIYWVCLITAALTGCKTYDTTLEHKHNPFETTINLDSMDREDWHEREEFLRYFE